MHDRTQPAFAFSNGRPDGLVFQTVSTNRLPPAQRYSCWAEEVIRSFDMAPADERQQRDFSGHVTSLADATGEMHYVAADGYEVRQPRHIAQDELALFLMLKGQARVSYQDGATRCVKAGQFFMLDGACTTRLAWTRHIVIQLDLPRAALESVFAGVVPVPEQANNALARSPLVGLLRHQLAEFPTLAAGLAAPEQRALLDASEALAIATLNGALSAHSKQVRQTQKGLLAAAQRLMHRQLDDPNLDVAAIALQLGCSRAALYRAFAAQQLSVADYLRTLRLRHAHRLLQQAPAHHTIAELAARCGFVDSAGFSRLFRQYYGVRPSDVRRGRLHTDLSGYES